MVYDILHSKPTATTFFPMPEDASSVIRAESAEFFPNFDEMLRKLSGELVCSPFKKLESFRFSFDGLNFEAHRVDRDKKAGFLINATVGFMPFTIESDERREAIKTIILATRRLPNVRFGVDISSRIMAGGIFDISNLAQPDFIFFPLMLFMQEAWPFIKLIGKYLSATPQVGAKAAS